MREQAELAAKSDGGWRRTVNLQAEPDGALVLTSHVMGAAPQAAWGADDEEITVRISPEEATKLAFALLVERLRNRPAPARVLIELCEAHDIACEVANWT